MPDVVTVGQLVDSGAISIGDGYRTKRSELGEPGYRILRVADVHDGAVHLQSGDFVSREFKRQIGPKLSRGGDVLLTTKGTVGRVAIYPEEAEKCVYSPQLCYFRINDSGVVSRGYLASWFKSSEFFHQASHRANNTDMAAYINLADIRSLALPLPSISEQVAIAEVLGALDNKIAANAQLSPKLDKLLSLQFRRMVGRWDELIRFNEMVSITRGVSYRSADLAPSSTALVTLKSFDRDGGYSTRGLKDYVGAYKTDQIVAPGELVVAMTDLTQAAEVIGRVARVSVLGGHDTLVASLDLAIVRPQGDLPLEFLQGVMADRRFRAHCRTRTSGTTVLHLSSSAIESFEGPIVPAVAQSEYAKIARPLHQRMDKIVEESLALAKTRDELLPLLMSGKVRVKDAEQAVDALV